MPSRTPSRLLRTLRFHSPSIAVAIALCLTLGLAPFHPEPHIVKQIRNIAQGQLREAIDVFDLVIHGFPFVVLLLVLVRVLRAPPGPRQAERKKSTDTSTRSEDGFDE